jgi:hypothetical protein
MLDLKSPRHTSTLPVASGTAEASVTALPQHSQNLEGDGGHPAVLLGRQLGHRRVSQFCLPCRARVALDLL